MHNYFGRSVGDAVVRSLAMGRDLDLFLADMGREPLTPAEAFELGREGGVRLWTRHGRRWVLDVAPPPPLGLDCIGDFAKGTEEFIDTKEDFGSSMDWWDSGYDSQCGPEDSVFWAFFEGELERSRQIDAAWDLHDCGFVPSNEFPVFLRRATPMEDVLDMQERIRRATRELEYRDIDRLTRAVSCAL